jgi:hypothetical protein
MGNLAEEVNNALQKPLSEKLKLHLEILVKELNKNKTILDMLAGKSYYLNSEEDRIYINEKKSGKAYALIHQLELLDKEHTLDGGILNYAPNKAHFRIYESLISFAKKYDLKLGPCFVKSLL